MTTHRFFNVLANLSIYLQKTIAIGSFSFTSPANLWKTVDVASSTATKIPIICSLPVLVVDNAILALSSLEAAET